MSSSRAALGGAVPRLLLMAPILLYAAWLLLELQRPDVLIVGNITVDLVEGTTPTGGAVSYAAVASRALGATSCVVTVAGPEADLGVFDGSHLFVLPANETLTFEHSYAWWGHSRRLRVAANPNITVARLHVPWRCRLARVVLLGPLTLHDVDAASFAAHDGFWDWLLNPDQRVGLMAQGFQRALGPQGEVVPLPAPSHQLLAGLSPRVSLFLSDVETDPWSEQQLAGVAAAAGRVIVTQGERGAELVQAAAPAPGLGDGGSGGGGGGTAARLKRTPIPAVKVPRAVDTNGAGDTFATVFMLADMRGDPDPGATAAWAASRAVLQPQTCKPRCAPLLLAAAPGGLPPIGAGERLLLAAAPLLRHAARAAAGGLGGLAGALQAAGAQPAWLAGAARQLRGWALSSVAVARGGGGGCGSGGCDAGLGVVQGGAASGGGARAAGDYA